MAPSQVTTLQPKCSSEYHHMEKNKLYYNNNSFPLPNGLDFQVPGEHRMLSVSQTPLPKPPPLWLRLMFKPFNGPSPRSRGRSHTRSQPTWGCPGTEGTRDHRGLVAEQADELASAHLLCLRLFRLKWHRAASDNETNHCSLDSVLPGTAPTRENHQEQFWSLKNIRENSHGETSLERSASP